MTKEHERVHQACRALLEEALLLRVSVRRSIAETRRVIDACRDVLIFELKPHLWQTFKDMERE